MLAELNKRLVDQVGGPKTPLGAFPIFELHPLQILGYLEAVWEAWRRLVEANPRTGSESYSVTAANATTVALGNVERHTTLLKAEGGKAAAATPLPSTFVLSDGVLALLRSRDPGFGPPTRLNLDVVGAVSAELDRMFQPVFIRNDFRSIRTPWKHISYAYLIENTNAKEIATRVLQGAFSDEPFGLLSDQSFRWLRLTEDLFFRDGITSLVSSITSSVRPDLRATFRNAYYRFLGIDLNHGAADGGPYPYVKAQAANTDFVRTLQDLLRELWHGFINSNNTSGPKTTDDTHIQELVVKLKTMLNERRLSGGAGSATRANLAREEFVAVATMEWFDLTLRSETPIVVDLKASGDQPEDRLRKLGERVKLPAHGKSRAFFQLSENLPEFLREIEEGEWDENARPVAELYDTKIAGNLSKRTTETANQWMIATGVDLKSPAALTNAR
jgi:hypothetical protein